MKPAPLLKLTLPNDLSYLDNARHFVLEAARRFGFTDEERMPIELGVEEAVTNVMQHAFDAEENAHFDILCEQLPIGMKIVIKERGIPYDPSRITAYHAGASLDNTSTRGLGTYLMQRVMDEVSFHNLGTGGKETHLIKYRKNHDPEASVETVAPTAEPDEPAVLAERIDYSVRGLEPSEAIQVSKCAYLSHGYSFFDDHIYYPERLIEMNQAGEMVSAVAVTREGTFMGHSAVVFPYPDDCIAELTFVFVNVEYRGQGAFKRMVDYLLTCPKPRAMRGLYAYAVSNHAFTQMANIRFGIKTCGILLATSPSSWKFKGIPESGGQRISVVLDYKYMEQPEPKTLFLPPHHRGMIAKLYQNIGATDHRYTECTTAPITSATTQLVTSTNPSESCAEIFVRSAGPDAAREIRRTLRAFCLDGIACINLFLSLEDPTTCTLTSEVESYGFFFAGILPYARIGDALILQYLNNVALDYTKIVAHADLTKELLAYIEQHDPNATI